MYGSCGTNIVSCRVPGSATLPDTNGHSPARLCSRTVLPMPDGPLISSVSPGSRLQVEGVHQVFAVGSAYFDIVDLQPAVRRCGGLHRVKARAREFSSSSPSRRMIAAR